MKGTFIHKKSFMYDEFSDSLMIFNKSNKDKVVGSVNVLNLTIDFTSNSRIANIEIKHISDLLKSLEINPEFLKELDDAEISLRQVRGGYLIYFLLKHNNLIERIPYNIQTTEEIILA